MSEEQVVTKPLYTVNGKAVYDCNSNMLMSYNNNKEWYNEQKTYCKQDTLAPIVIVKHIENQITTSATIQAPVKYFEKFENRGTGDLTALMWVALLMVLWKIISVEDDVHAQGEVAHKQAQADDGNRNAGGYEWFDSGNFKGE